MKIPWSRGDKAPPAAQSPWWNGRAVRPIAMRRAPRCRGFSQGSPEAIAAIAILGSFHLQFVGYIYINPY